MEKELRSHPRIPTHRICWLQSTERGKIVDATTFCVATHGVGLTLVEPTTDTLSVGDGVAVSLSVGGEIRELGGTVAWIQRAGEASTTAGIRLDTDSGRIPDSYLQWVEKQYLSLRERSMELGSELAIQRKISLRDYQDALDAQAQAGGYLDEHLQ